MSVNQDWVERHDEQSTLVGFIVTGPTTPNGVAAELMAEIPTTYDWRVLNRIQSIELVPGTSDTWMCTVKYAAYQEKRELQSGDMEFRYQTGGEQTRRTISITSRVFDADGLISPAPSDAHVIGWNPASNSAEGVTVDERAYQFGWTVIVPFATATETWRRQVGELVKTVCSGTFFGYAAGEVRLDQVSGTVRGAADYRMELQFSRRPNFGLLLLLAESHSRT